MGNTILAHALFACNQAHINLDNFFSSTGDAHAIPLLNTTCLTAGHLREFPTEGHRCVIEIVCDGWAELLRIKMSYSKWYKAVPQLDNYTRFFDQVVNSQSQTDVLWQEFYQQYKDPQWPACERYQDIAQLPEAIQNEIKEVYIEPGADADSSEIRFVEWLSMCYYDMLGNSTLRFFDEVPMMLLDDYLLGQTSALQVVCEQLNWQWDDKRSAEFHQYMLLANSKYFEWLDNIKATVDQVINNQRIDNTLDLWEQALVIAKVCRIASCMPSEVHWQSGGCNTNEKSAYLNKFKEEYHGKTI